ERMTANINEYHSLRKLRSRQSRIFRNARVGELTMNFEKRVIDEEVLDQVTGQIHFLSLKVHMHEIMQPRGSREKK
ncbi:hypothetical protein PFISCL1PPCAC_25141, partial [Pristionchus fissidentatus]